MYGNYAKKRQKKKKLKKKGKRQHFIPGLWNRRFHLEQQERKTLLRTGQSGEWLVSYILPFFHFSETFGTLFRLLIYANKSMPILNWTYVALYIRIRGYLLTEINSSLNHLRQDGNCK